MKIKSFLIILLIAISNLNAQNKTTVMATDEDISRNLDLEAVATIFGESKDLEDFENKLNDPNLQVSNLDLNNDNEIDYLRVLTESKGNTNVVTIQAVLGKNQYQDVATIDVEKDSSGTTHVQVIGETYIYGPQYIIEPVYIQPPIIFNWFWGPFFRPWYSPFYWGYYPPYFRPWHPYPVHHYHNNINVNINVNRNNYNHTSIRRSTTATTLESKNRRNDYAKRNPDQSFTNRNKGVTNKDNLKPLRKTPSTLPAMKPATKPTTRPTTKPAAKPVTRPATQPTNRPVTRSATQPNARPTTRPTTTRPVSRPAPRNVARPARRF